MDPKKNKTSKSINDIFEKVKRQKNSFYRYHTYEIDSLIKLIESAKQIDPILLLYIPIRLVTFIECYFKDLVREFVDHDGIYANALIHYLKDISIDMDFINFLSGKIITVGSIISQIVSIQRVDSIFNVMEKLLGNKSFKVKLSNYLCNHTEQSITLDSLIATLQELNKHRNIIVHENSNLVLQEGQLIIYAKHTKLFLEATNHITSEILYPDTPTTQMQMNHLAAEKANEINSEIRKLISNILVYIRKKNQNLQAKQFLVFYKQREKSMEEYGKFQANFYKGGSIYPLIYFSAITEARENFLAELKQNLINYQGGIEIHPLSLYEGEL